MDLIRQSYKKYFVLMRLNKPIGILLLLWPTLWALWLAGHGRPHALVLIIFIVGVVLTRSAGCIINDVADRHVDAFVKRTSTRPLATGIISVKCALFLCATLSLLAFSLVVLFLNTLTIVLAIVGAGLAFIYPFMKRFTHLPQVGLGFAFSWGVPMAFAAEQNAVPYAAWIVYFTAVIWPVMYDTMYAMTDREDDIKIGIKSTAILFAQYDRFIIACLQGLFLLGLVYVGYLFSLTHAYYVSLLVVIGFFYYQHVLIKNRDPQRCFQAFLNNHWVGRIIFVGLMVGMPA